MTNEYRTETKEFLKETKWTFWKSLPIIITIIIVISIISFGLKSLGLIGSTIIEREVFKQSFQYKEGMAQRAAIMEANIAEITIMLQSNPENKQNLIKQKMILNAQLRAITINQ